MTYGIFLYGQNFCFSNCNICYTKVSTWFANARRRLKKESKFFWQPKSKNNENSLRNENDDEEADDECELYPSDNYHSYVNNEKEDVTKLEFSSNSNLLDFQHKPEKTDKEGLQNISKSDYAFSPSFCANKILKVKKFSYCEKDSIRDAEDEKQGKNVDDVKSRTKVLNFYKSKQSNEKQILNLDMNNNHQNFNKANKNSLQRVSDK